MAVRHRSVSWLAPLAVVMSLGAAAPALPLVDAVRNADREAVRALLEKKSIDVNAPGVDGATALHWAVQRDDLETVELLIRAGADVKAANRYGVRPLSLAAINGHAGIIERLVKAGADANTELPEGETALMTAARTGKTDALRVLLTHGATVNAREGYRGQTALMWAAARNNVEAIKMLLEAGADLQARTNNPRPAQPRSVFGEVRAPATSFSAFLFAVRAGQLEAAKALLAAGAHVNDTLSDGNSALVVATANAHWQVADWLLDQGADPNAAGSGWNALHQIIHGRRPNIPLGDTPVATGTVDSLSVIKKMIAHGVNVNARMSINGMKDGQRVRVNRLGATPFFLAAKNTDVEVMRVLVAAGANPRIRNVDNSTALMVAAGLLAWIPGEDGGSLSSQADEQLEAVRLCVELGLDVNATNDRNETALHGAAYRGVNAIAQYLLDQGARIDAREGHGWTALAIARGFTYTGNYKEQPQTAELLTPLMEARGLPTAGEVVEQTICDDCLQTDPPQGQVYLGKTRQLEADYAAGKYDWQNDPDAGAPTGR